jgi:4-carboxymuconolactone decarboxylase
MALLHTSQMLNNADRREFMKAGTALLIAALWRVGAASAQEKRMTDANKPNRLPSVLTYDDVRAVSPALKHYTKGPLLDGV